jgi:hypothetical protein
MAHLLFVDESGQDRGESPYEVLGGIAIKDSSIWPLILDLQEAEVTYFWCACFARRSGVESEEASQEKDLSVGAGSFRHLKHWNARG